MYSLASQTTAIYNAAFAHASFCTGTLSLPHCSSLVAMSVVVVLLVS